jgi:DNA-binding NarL/FixJ family response regulator
MSSTLFNTKHKPSILVVDDSLPFVSRIINLLVTEVRNIGHINIASGYAEATRLFKEEKPDIVLLDISMPGKSGVELLKEIKQGDNDSQVIMLTNHGDDFYRNYCYELGVDYFLDKSTDFTKVPVIINSARSKPGE